jgi:hypothetical protein
MAVYLFFAPWNFPHPHHHKEGGQLFLERQRQGLPYEILVDFWI